MKLHALRLYNVKRFEGRGIAIEDIGDGVNVLCVPNETGKSTSFEALHALFFLPHSITQRKEVQNLRPYSGGNPLIEVDIATTQGDFRIRKQFLGKSFAQILDLKQRKLLLQADEAENFIAALIKEGIGGPAGLLWVRQGVNTLEKQGGNQGMQEQQARIGLLQSVQGEVDAITGGRRMDAILDKVSMEIKSLVTARGAKTGGRYHQAILSVEQLESEEQRLGAEVTALRQALDERSKLQKRLNEYEASQAVSERQQELEQAQQAFDNAKLHHEKIKAAQAVHELAQQKHEIATRNLTNFRQARAQLFEIQQQFQHLPLEREAILMRRHQATAEFEQAMARSKQATVQIEKCRKQLQQALAANQLASLQQQLTQANQLNEAFIKAKLEREHIKITPQRWQELQKIDIDIARLQAAANTKRASFTVHYHSSTAARMKYEDIEITEAEEYFYAPRAQLEVPHMGTITLHSHIDPKADQDLVMAQKQYRQLLAELRLEDLSQAQTDLARAQELDNALAQLRLSLEQIAPQGLTTLQVRLVELEAMVDGSLAMQQDQAQLNLLLTQAEQDHYQAQADLQRIQAQRLALEQELSKLEGQLATLKAEKAQLEVIIGAAHAQDERQYQLTRMFDDSMVDLAAANRQLEILQQKNIDFEAARIRLARLQSAHVTITREISHLRETLAGLSAVIATHCDQAIEEIWHEVKEKLERARTRLIAEQAHLAALQRLNMALTRAREGARDLYLMPIMRELTPLLKLIFDDLALHFNDKTLLPQHIMRDGRQEDIERLSGGMREQISILTRLAFARLLAHKGQEVPVILDDALVYCDDERIEKMFDVLHHQAAKQQIIVFSCRNRAFARLGGNRLQMRDWCP